MKKRKIKKVERIRKENRKESRKESKGKQRKVESRKK